MPDCCEGKLVAVAELQCPVKLDCCVVTLKSFKFINGLRARVPLWQSPSPRVCDGCKRYH